MRLVYARITAVLVALLSLVGCTDIVLNPISPQEARRQVIDVSKQVVSDLGGEVADATFGYSSCNDQGEAPFQAHANLGLWIPGADRSREVSPNVVLDRLRQHGWQTDPDFHSHGTTFKRDGQDVVVWVIPPPKPNDPPIAHVSIDVLGECRDTFDHRSDQTNSLFENIRGELTSG
ncbi:MAG: hypothetical protein JWR34_3703 [Mycobacterium sp.]|nr:hypothetical protein [Mycobacterium sp.]